MDINEATKRVRGAGWAGVCIWNVGAGWNGWLIRPNACVDTDTALWNHRETAQEALEGLVAYAEKHTFN